MCDVINGVTFFKTNNMKKLMLVAFAAILSLASFAQDKGMKFTEGTLLELREAAKKAGKPIFIDIYATWCGPCKTLARDVFPNETVGTYMNANFINGKFDAEKGEGIELAKTFAIKGYPTVLVLDAEGKEIGRSVGVPLDPAKFIARMKEVAAGKK